MIIKDRYSLDTEEDLKEAVEMTLYLLWGIEPENESEKSKISNSFIEDSSVSVTKMVDNK